jgi:hypothetical protein
MPRGKGLWYSMERLGGPLNQFGYDVKRYILAHAKNRTMELTASYF